MHLSPIDQVWLLACSGLILLMQGGFLCLEAGLTRSKNSVNVALKNLVDLTVTPLLFVGFGSGIMFGPSWGGVFGVAGTLHGFPAGSTSTFLIFQACFCASAATIVSGAVAERMRFGAYGLMSVMMGALVYPLVGHWVWGGVWDGSPGWLERLGFNDFAGSAVVHMVGGFAALAGAVAVGPRIGRFDPGRVAIGFPKSNLPLSMLGVSLLCVGWIGFNGGSVLRLDERVGPVTLNTLLSGSAGGVAAIGLALAAGRSFAPETVINGLLAGMVAVCALADVANAGEAMGVGAVAACAAYLAERALVRLRIDDVVGAFPVHGVGGLVGVLAQPLMSGADNPEGLATALVVQGLGAAAVGAGAFTPCYAVLAWGLPASWRRVSAADEHVGLNISEHGVESELQTLLRSLVDDRNGPIADAGRIDASDDAGALAEVVRDRAATAERRQADELRDYGRFLHAVLDGIDLQVCILDSAGRIVETNQAWDRFAVAVGAEPEAAVGASFPRLCATASVYGGGGPEEIAKAVQDVTSGYLAHFAGEYPALTPGDERLLEVTVRPLPKHDRGAVIITQQDRTDERLAQRQMAEEKQRVEMLADALEASQASFDLAVKGAGLGRWHWDVASGYFELSADWADQLDAGPQGLGADIESFRKLIPEEEHVFWTAADAESLGEGEPYDRHFRLRGRDGSLRWVQALGRALTIDSRGVPDCLGGILIDINDRKSAELRDVGMARIIEESDNEVYVVDRETLRFLEVNRGARENLGYTPSELHRMTPMDIHPTEDAQDVEDIISRVLRSSGGRVTAEVRHLRKDGTSYPALVTIQTGRLLERDVLVAIGSDVTERRRLENELADARRLESVGQLAAGVAHEMNTPLQFVGNNIQFLDECAQVWLDVLGAYDAAISTEVEDDAWRRHVAAVREKIKNTRFDRLREETPKAIAESKDGIQRVLQIVRAMKEFSHPGGEGKSPTDLNRALESTATITRNRWKSVAELELRLDPYLPVVECEGGAINQVFVNLIVNAADAIAERREKDPDAPPGRIEVRSRQEGDSAVFEVEDNGCGMPPAVRDRVFDPFFTTKVVGKGTGQGLTLSHAIVCQKHDGAIDAQSVVGVGTVMRVTLPVTAPTVAEASR